MRQRQIHRSTFEGGLNTDVSKALINPNQYVEANNLTLVGSGDFLSLTNIKGTTNLNDIITTPDTEVLGVFATRYTIGDVTDVKCLTIFTHDTVASVNTLKITVYDIDNDDVYLIYSEEVDDDYLADDRVIDGVLYPENGLDILYYTDNYFRPRKLRCVIPLPYTVPFLISTDLDLLRTPTLGIIDLVSVSEGGSLLTGTYQLAYQLFNSDTNKYTGFSLLTNPIHVYNHSDSDIVKAGIGIGSDRKIVIDITPIENELSYYTHFRVAVLENVGTGTETTNVGITSLETIADFESGGIIEDYEIKSNAQYSYTTLDDLVIDLAAIQTAKTLTVKDNRLLLGNIVNSNLEYDNGDPAITSGSIVIGKMDIVEIDDDEEFAPNSSEDEFFQSTKRGHFRDEVYRYAISYFDDNGYFSTPKVLDLSTITYNQIAADSPDVRYPSRLYSSGGVYFSVMDEFDRFQHLGLELNGITNHPSWARGFIILRAKRRKNIMFQTPIIPMSKIYGIGAVGKYPTQYLTGEALTETTNTELTPMGPSSTYVPYNMFLLSPTHSPSQNNVYVPGSGTNAQDVGESLPLYYHTSADFAMIFPPDTMYKDEPYSFSGTERLGFVDASLCEIYHSKFQQTDPDTAAGHDYYSLQGADTSIAANFHSVKNELQYFGYGHNRNLSDLNLNSRFIPISSGMSFDNYDEGKQFLGESIGDYSKIMTEGISFGYLPSNQRSTIIPFNSHFICAYHDYYQPIDDTEFTPYFQPIEFPNRAVSAIRRTVDGFDAGVYEATNKVLMFPTSVINVNEDPVEPVNGLWKLPIANDLGSWNVGTNTPALADKQAPGFGYSDFELINDSAPTFTPGYYTVTNAGLGGTTFDFGDPDHSVLVKNGDVIMYNPYTLRWEVVYTDDALSNNYKPFPDYITVKGNILEINNVLSGLDDFRYGNSDSYNEYIFTGTKVVFTNAEISGGVPDKDVEVWGGDCTISPHTFKVADSTYAIANQLKTDESTFGISSNGFLSVPIPTVYIEGRDWKTVWTTTSETGLIRMPVLVKNAAQYITVVLESEYNGAIIDHDSTDYLMTATNEWFTHGGDSILTSCNVKIIGAPSENKARYSRPYLYNTNLNKENSQKLFLPVDEVKDVITNYPARILYSDLKVYQTDLEGFDSFRVGSYLDTVETYGGITKLSVVGDKLFSVQERGVATIPVGERVIETTDTSQLAIRSGEFLAPALYINSSRGSQHLRSFINTGKLLYFLDNENRSVYSLDQSGDLNAISDNGISSFLRDDLSQGIAEKDIIGVYDPVRGQYWIANKSGDFCYVWNNLLNKWETNVTISASAIGGGALLDNDLYVVGKDFVTTDTSVYSMFSGSNDNLFGKELVPFVKFSINTEKEISKSYDSILVNSYDKPDSGFVRTGFDGLSGVAPVTTFLPQRGEGNWKSKIMRNTNGPTDSNNDYIQRMRGNHATLELTWETGSDVKLSSVLTKYRQSFNIF